MPAPERARIGLIGAGWWMTEHHIPSLLADKRAQIVGVADVDPAKLSAVRRIFGIDAVFQHHTTMLSEVRPDAVIIAVPHAFHAALTRDALLSGAHVMVEKPMTLDSTDAWDLVDLARARGLHLTVGYPWNYTSHAAAARDVIRHGEIGDIQLVTGLYASMVVEFYRGNPEAYRQSFGFPVTPPRRDTYSDPTIAGGGQGHLQVTHLAGLILWETGLRADSVAAMMQNFDVPVDLVDSVSVRFTQGALATLASTGNIAPHQRQHCEIRIFGSKGSIVHDVIPGTLSLHRADGSVRTFRRLAARNAYPSHATAQNLVDLALGGTETSAPGELGARVVELLEAAYRSASTGGPVHVGSGEVIESGNLS